MPRELFHWKVLEEALAHGASSFPTVAECCTRFPSISLLGAVAHDAPYYRSYGKSSFESVSERMHGTDGDDTYIPFRTGVAQLKESQPEQRLKNIALMSGMLSHLAADAVVHPWIYFATGDYYHPDKAKRLAARANHRELEVYLDSWTRETLRWEGSDAVAELLKSDTVNTQLWKFLATIAPEEGKSVGENAESWKAAYFDLAQIQSLMFSPVVGVIFWLAAKVISPLRPLFALSTFSRERPPAWMDGPFVYKNPVTGETLEATVRSLFEDSVARTAEELKRLELTLAGEPAFASAGPSLNSGIPGTVRADFKHFGGGSSNR